MQITYKAVMRFVQKEGRVDVIDTEGKTKMLDDGPDSIDLVERTANKFRFNGIWYTREEFGKLLEQKLSEK